MRDKPVNSIFSIILIPVSLLNFGLLIPWDPLMEIHERFGDMAVPTAFFGTIIGILGLLKGEPRKLALFGLIGNGIPLAAFAFIMIIMFIAYFGGPINEKFVLISTGYF
ncbi:hypothetical protein [Mesobacillus foraminis]|uniref:Uncharacterized protein n=1 Tax=Mesobacillus foraminis TaxID=279826 RepID=A0A4R2AXI4_9BACI|nr:hypothetical protein [Mesobacillus foraminis]TCN18405.1 hypothetical protein EV146_1203 [Mesobacillus foraminis]